MSPCCFLRSCDWRRSCRGIRGGWRQEMAEDFASNPEGDACNSSERGMQEPESRGRHFFEETADPANAQIRGEERNIVDADDGTRERRGGDTRVEREGNRKDVSEPSAVQDVESEQPAERYLASGPRG